MRLPLALAILTAPSAHAADIGLLHEVRFGLLAHDISFLGGGAEDGVDVNFELLFDSPGFLDIILSPHPHLGAQINTSGDASQFYAGLTWRFGLFGPTWLGLAAGGSIHDGDLGEGPGRTALGSRALFRLAAEVGWDLTERLSVSLYYDHESNAGFADNNEGLNNAGMRVGWRF